METPLAWEFLKLILGEERLDFMVHIPQNGLKYNSYHVLGRLFTRITSSLILHQNLNDGLLFPSQKRKVGFNKKNWVSEVTARPASLKTPEPRRQRTLPRHRADHRVALMGAKRLPEIGDRPWADTGGGARGPAGRVRP